MSSSFGSCLRPAAASGDRNYPPVTGKANLATCLYHTDLGLFSLTWSRSFLARSLHLHHYPAAAGDGDCALSPFSLPATPSSSLSSSASLQIRINPFFFWRRVGSRKLHARPANNSPAAPAVQVFWDLSRAKFGSGPEPESGFYIAVVVDGEMALVVGDSADRAYKRTKAHKPARGRSGQTLVLRREHVIAQRVYTTRANFGGKSREISVNCGVSDDARLCFAVDGKKVLTVKRLKWKFRGNERIEVDGVPVQISWDVYNWLFDGAGDAHAVFMFRFENESGIEDDGGEESESAQQQLSASSSCSFGMNGVEMRKMRRSFLRSSARSSSSSSMSSASSACSSSVMEWASTEESDRLSGPTGFSLLIYAWKK